MIFIKILFYYIYAKIFNAVESLIAKKIYGQFENLNQKRFFGSVMIYITASL